MALRRYGVRNRLCGAQQRRGYAARYIFATKDRGSSLMPPQPLGQDLTPGEFQMHHSPVARNLRLGGSM